MGLIIKHTLKSMWAHKVRTLILLFGITMCSLAALLSFNMSGTLETAIRSAYQLVAGTTDITITSSYDLGDDFAEGIPESTILNLVTGSTTFTKRIVGTYDAYTQTTCTIIGVDPESALTMGAVPKDIDLGDAKAAIDKGFAADYGYDIGDTILLYSDSNEPVEFVVSGIYGSDSGLFSTGNIILVDLASMEKLDSDGVLETSMAYIDVHDNDRVQEAVEILEEKNPAATVQAILENEQIKNSVESLTRIFVVMFAVCLLLVIFVTISSSQRIITDKMPVIGTFRSLGVSAGQTYAVLFGENIMYGLIGSVLGTMLYQFIKPMFFESMISISNTSGETITPDYGSTSIVAIVTVILCGVLLECICPLKEILLAVKMPIRDIIFSNKDTQYKHGRAGTAAGIALVGIAVVTLFFRKNFIAGLICFASMAIGAALLFPYVLRFFAGLLAKGFDMVNQPIARLAAIEVREKKSTVGSSVLCFTAVALAIVIYAFASSFSLWYSHENTSADVIAYTNGTTERPVFSYIQQLDGVDAVEMTYDTIDNIGINDKQNYSVIPVTAWAEGGYCLYSGAQGVPDDLGYEEIVVGETLAERYGLKAGDKVEITFKADGFMPTTKTLTVRSIELIDYTNTIGTSVVISQKLYIEMYKDRPSSIYICCDDAEAVKTSVEKYSADMISSVKTYEEYREETEADNASIMMVIKAIIVLAVSMTFIGVAGNQLIGFEGRKRECAVLSSVAMTKAQLSMMFFMESFIAAGIALITAVPLAVFMAKVFMEILSSLMFTLPINKDISVYISLGLLLWAVFTTISLFPIRAMRKMNTTAQLKYE